MNILEICGVAFSVIYLILASRENIWCWPAAIVSTVIYTYIFIDAQLYFETVLQGYYLVMALYGWYAWRNPGDKKDLPISSLPANMHVIFISGGLLLSGLLGYLAWQYTDASFPFQDAFTTVFGILTTWMVARKILENWIYWFVIDAVSVYLYLNKDLYFTAGLFTYYVAMTVYGYIVWRKRMHETT